MRGGTVGRTKRTVTLTDTGSRGETRSGVERAPRAGGDSLGMEGVRGGGEEIEGGDGEIEGGDGVIKENSHTRLRRRILVMIVWLI